MRLGFYTLITPEFSLNEIIPAAKRWGFDGLEWRVSEPGEPKCGEVNYWKRNLCSIPPGDIAKVLPGLVREAKIQGIESVTICPYVYAHEVDKLEALFIVAAAAGVSAVRVQCPSYNRERNYNEQFSKFREDVAHVEVIAKRHGVRACIQQHRGSLLATASASRRLIEDRDPQFIGIRINVGHLVTEGYEQFGIIVDVLGEYLAHVHVMNGTLVPTGVTTDGYVQYEAAWGKLDRGYVNLGVLGDKLRSVAFKGWLMLEDFSNRPTDDRMTEGMAILKKMAGI